jgi:hypothetical protein
MGVVGPLEFQLGQGRTASPSSPKSKGLKTTSFHCNKDPHLSKSAQPRGWEAS